MNRCIIIVALLLCAGCIPTVQQVQTATSRTDDLMVVVDNLQNTMDLLAGEGIVNSERVKAISAELDRAQDDIIVVNEAIKEKADEGVVEQLVAANEASKPFNPYANEVSAVLGLVTVIGGIWAKGEHDKKVVAESERQRTESKRQADKEGRELALRQIAAFEGTLTASHIKEVMYKAIGDARRGNGIT